MKNEIWRPIKGFPNYEISTHGRVRSNYLRGRSGGHGRFNRVLKQRPNTGGYPTVSLYRNRKAKTVPVHRLVAGTFLKPKKNRPEVNHINAKITDNRLVNLEYCNRKENVHHAIKMGIHHTPPAKRKLTDKQVLAIFSQREKPDHLRLALKYGVHRTVISLIKRGKIYSWLTNKHAVSNGI